MLDTCPKLRAYISKHQENLCQTRNFMRGVANGLIQTSVVIIAHASLLHTEVKQLQSNLDALQPAIQDLDADLKNAHHALEVAKNNAQYSTAVQDLLKAVHSVCARAAVILERLDSIIQEVDSSEKEAKQGNLNSAFLLFSGCAAVIGASIAAIGLGAATTVLAEEVTLLRIAGVTGCVSGCVGIAITDETIKLCKQVRSSAQVRHDNIKEMRKDLTSGLAQYYLDKPEAYCAAVCDHDTSKSPIKRERGNPIKEEVDDLLNGLLLERPDKAIDFIANFPKKAELVKHSDLVDRELIVTILKHWRVEEGKPLAWQVERLLKLEQCGCLLQRVLDWEAQLARDVLGDKVGKYDKQTFRKLVTKFHPDRYEGEELMKALNHMRDTFSEQKPARNLFQDQPLQGKGWARSPCNSESINSFWKEMQNAQNVSEQPNDRQRSPPNVECCRIVFGGPRKDVLLANLLLVKASRDVLEKSSAYLEEIIAANEDDDVASKLYKYIELQKLEHELPERVETFKKWLQDTSRLEDFARFTFAT
ncbi:unnamed protein product [Durusdinium trenchii]|uniref:Uncharacterized protein n=1 Tax=Durusdinium trenchii TaxID=1381693 RepID=A0ABP0L8S5_9DINO